MQSGNDQLERQPLRVLLADDSAVFRKLLQNALTIEGRIKVVAAAKDGNEAFQLYKVTDPDVVLLDVGMPVMDGIETLIAIRRANKDVPVVMFSNLTNEGSPARLDALMYGANACVEKPIKSENLDDAIGYIHTRLVPLLEKSARHEITFDQVSAKSQVQQRPRPGRRAPVRRSEITGKGSDLPLKYIVVASSTGGPDALRTFLQDIPKSFPIPILIAQHMPANFTSMLAQELNLRCELNVQQAVAGTPVTPGNVFIAPGDRHMTMVSKNFRIEIGLNDDPPENSCRPAADVLFRSAANCSEGKVLGLVLTGMGKDGMQGGREIVDAGGRVWAQDEASSVIWSMPSAVINAGIAERVVSIGSLAAELVQAIELTNHTRIK